MTPSPSWITEASLQLASQCPTDCAPRLQPQGLGPGPSASLPGRRSPPACAPLPGWKLGLGSEAPTAHVGEDVEWNPRPQARVWGDTDRATGATASSFIADTPAPAHLRSSPLEGKWPMERGGEATLYQRGDGSEGVAGGRRLARPQAHCPPRYQWYDPNQHATSAMSLVYSTRSCLPELRK